MAVLDKIPSAGGVLIKAAGYASQLPEGQKTAQNDLSLLQMENLHGLVVNSIRLVLIVRTRKPSEW
ncbi:MAG: hypothetical protein PHU23_05225 [Dehalococcoidales bacterium]|nr:hypothetical protein [Dehalococcoidales bacterium]